MNSFDEFVCGDTHFRTMIAQLNAARSGVEFPSRIDDSLPLCFVDND